MIFKVTMVSYSSPSIFRLFKSRRMRWVGHVVRTGERKVLYEVLVGKLKEKRPFGRPSRRRENNIKMDVQEVGVGVWTGSFWLRTGTSGGHL